MADHTSYADGSITGVTSAAGQFGANEVLTADALNAAFATTLRQPSGAISEMNLNRGSLVVGCTQPMPNRWHRFWQRALLGITWRDLRPERAIDELKKLR